MDQCWVTVCLFSRVFQVDQDQWAPEDPVETQVIWWVSSPVEYWPIVDCPLGQYDHSQGPQGLSSGFDHNHRLTTAYTNRSGMLWPHCGLDHNLSGLKGLKDWWWLMCGFYLIHSVGLCVCMCVPLCVCVPSLKTASLPQTQTNRCSVVSRDLKDF